MTFKTLISNRYFSITINNNNNNNNNHGDDEDPYRDDDDNNDNHGVSISNVNMKGLLVILNKTRFYTTVAAFINLKFENKKKDSTKELELKTE